MAGRILLKHKINYSRFPYSTCNGLRNKRPKTANDNIVTKEAIKIVKDYSQKESTVLSLNLLRTTIVAHPSNASKWQMGFNSAFKGLKKIIKFTQLLSTAGCSNGPDIFVDVP